MHGGMRVPAGPGGLFVGPICLTTSYRLSLMALVQQQHSSQDIHAFCTGKVLLGIPDVTAIF